MSVKVSIEHRTEYAFDRPAELGPHEIRLRPAPHATTPIDAYSLAVTPAEHAVSWRQDAFGNHVARVSFPKRITATALTLEVGLVAELAPNNPFDFSVREDAEQWPFRYAEADRRDLAPFLKDPAEKPTPLLAQRIAVIGRESMATVEFLVALNAILAEQIEYTTRAEPGVQTPEQTLQLRSGSCRDTSWLLVALLRGLGLAARFTSGYLVQLEPKPGAADTSDLHAWPRHTSPGPAGWGWTRPPGCSPARATFHWRARRRRRARRR
jgi:transglutaminase-like putative cysteine protease